ncbi:DUF2512 family protein [Pseudogracilibacillus sp. SO30301A]|uniref:DUF2512 family protein n=1 Tax=Pseudogracilibacillus sp. SO30301A TaxID=3098291 RepID=UPI00300DE65A
MRRITAFIIKFIMMTFVLWIVLGLYFNVSFGSILVASIILTTVTFLVDIYLLPRIGNIMAAVGDFAIVYFGLWFIGRFILNEAFSLISITNAAFMSALLILIGELFYHRYLLNVVFENVQDDDKHYKQKEDKILQTEVANEFDKTDKDK